MNAAETAGVICDGNGTNTVKWADWRVLSSEADVAGNKKVN